MMAAQQGDTRVLALTWILFSYNIFRETGAASIAPGHSVGSRVCHHIPPREHLLAIAERVSHTDDEPRIVNQRIPIEEYTPGELTLVSVLYDDSVKNKLRYYALQVLSNGKPEDSGRFKGATNGLKLRHCNGMTVLVDVHDITRKGVTFRWIPPLTFQGPLEILVSRITEDVREKDVHRQMISNEEHEVTT